MKSYILLVLSILIGFMPLSAKVLCTKPDSLKIISLVKNAPREATPYYFSRQFLGIPYVGATLERSLTGEPLVINLHELDCTTIVEVVAALWHTQRDYVAKPSMADAAIFQHYCQWLEKYRYWAGRRNGYCSRHHYFSWWWHDNVKQGLLEEVDLAPSGGKLAPLMVKLGYMSLYPNRYRQLAANPQWVEKLKPLEQEYSVRDGYYLPKAELNRLSSAALKSVIKDGDIIAIVTTKGGLDYSHLGFASWHKDGKLHLLNASMRQKKVIDDTATLYQYLSSFSTSVGIRVFRLK